MIDCHPEYLDCVSGIDLVVTMDDFACDLGALDPLSVSIEANPSDTCHGSFDHSSLVGKSGPNGADVITKNASKKGSAHHVQNKRKQVGGEFTIPKIPKVHGLSDSDDNESQAHVSDHESRNSDFSESDSEHDEAKTSTGSSVSDSDPDSDPVANNRHRSSKSHIKAPQSQSGVGVSRFDPFSNNSSQDWSLNSGQDDYVRKYFSQWLGDPAVKDAILDSNPRPKMGPQALNLDNDILDLLPHGAQAPTKQTDFSLKRIQNKILDIMGPLGKLWATLEQAQESDDMECDLEALLTLVQQAVLMTGQTNVLVNHNRRLIVLSRFFRDNKKAGEVLGQNEELLRSNDQALFGRPFFKALHRKAKGNKKSKEIRAELGSGIKRGNTIRFSANTKSKGKGEQSSAGPNRHPFRKSLPSVRGGGGRGRGSTRRGGANSGGYRQKRYVFISSKHTSTPSRYSTQAKIGKQSSGSPNYSGLKIVRNKRGPAVRGEDTFLSPQLGKNNSRFSSTRGHNRLQTRFNSQSCTTQGASCPKFLRSRASTDRRGDSRHAKQRGNRNHPEEQRAVSKSHLSKIEERPVVPPSVQLEEAERVHTLRALQDGGDANVGRHNQTRRPHVQDRFEGRLLLHPSCKGAQATPEIFMEKSALSVQSASVRSGVSSTYFHKDSEANYQSFETSRSPLDNFLGRPNSSTSGEGRGTARLSQCHVDVGTLRVCNKPKEVRGDPNTKDRILRICGELTGHESISTNGQIDQHPRE